MAALDETVGGSSSNSYVTQAEADTYFVDRYDSTVWDALTDAQKENALITAVKQIDQLDFLGSRYGTDVEGDDDYQRLEFPRSYTTDIDGNAIVPIEVKEAQYEQAFHIVSYGSEIEKRAAVKAQGVKSFSLGGVENLNLPSISETYDGSLINPISSIARELLKKHIDNSIVVLRK